ncbi:class I SAM-dependent methyltransferase [Corynebacterium sp. ES2794-CONJ1]|uniref:class I SAM-dependent methyltransferase n=1 Tax=Corynebacterium sp. ES2794-CONJ1 TaxID=2980553 RepID=UPI0021D9167F|nr:class I SAM-dependent methyltransferase [Corynebacterium sp. ES2794-CONJ1]MCU9518277.1 class I SAM-dependent methyltransferase [Corynebacterium sp. ES2794-CONJ1]
MSRSDDPLQPLIKDPYAQVTTPIPSISQRHLPRFRGQSHRKNMSQAFITGATLYHDIRPSYPIEVLDLIGKADKVLDVGAGTGKFTELLAQDSRFQQIYALEPSADMARSFTRALPQIPILRANAEEIPCTEGSFDLITVAQAWHWMDNERASKELARISTIDASVLLVWNTLDVDIPWVHRLSRIMHSGDTLKRGFVPQVAPPWLIVEDYRGSWDQIIYPPQLLELAQTRSYWLRARDKDRERLTKNLTWYLFEKLELDPARPLALPYRVDAFLLQKAR